MRNEIIVRASKEYKVVLEPGSLDKLGVLVKGVIRGDKIAILTDTTVDSEYGERAEAALKSAGFQVCKQVFPSGEASKNFHTIAEFVDFLAENHLSRKDLVVALGGGVTGDMAGFSAAIYLRGIDFIQVPTTLLAAIDSSVGGKTGVNIAAGKNLMGAFWQPSLVVCDPTLFVTMDQDIRLDGMAEILKTGAIYDTELFHRASRQKNLEDIQPILCRCVEIKGEVVEQDEKEGGLRQILNFGHTIGHAIEKYYQYQQSHGKAVAKGMALITKASEKQGFTKPGTYDLLVNGLTQAGLNIYCEIPIDILCKNALSDKKVAGEKINLVILEEIGFAKIIQIDTAQLLDFFS